MCACACVGLLGLAIKLQWECTAPRAGCSALGLPQLDRNHQSFVGGAGAGFIIPEACAIHGTMCMRMRMWPWRLWGCHKYICSYRGRGLALPRPPIFHTAAALKMPAMLKLTAALITASCYYSMPVAGVNEGLHWPRKASIARQKP